MKKILQDMFSQYEIKWATELGWAVLMAAGTGSASVFLAGQGAADRTTFLSAVLAAGIRPALAILGTRVTTVVGKLTASPAAPQRYVPMSDGGILDTQTGETFVRPMTNLTYSSPSSEPRITTISSAVAAPPPTQGGSV